MHLQKVRRSGGQEARTRLQHLPCNPTGWKGGVISISHWRYAEVSPFNCMSKQWQN